MLQDSCWVTSDQSSIWSYSYKGLPQRTQPNPHRCLTLILQPIMLGCRPMLFQGLCVTRGTVLARFRRVFFWLAGDRRGLRRLLWRRAARELGGGQAGAGGCARGRLNRRSGEGGQRADAFQRGDEHRGVLVGAGQAQVQAARGAGHPGGDVEQRQTQTLAVDAVPDVG